MSDPMNNERFRWEGPHNPYNNPCWVDGFSYMLCCNPAKYGAPGNLQCWDDVYSADRCCHEETDVRQMVDKCIVMETGEEEDDGSTDDCDTEETIEGETPSERAHRISLRELKASESFGGTSITTKTTKEKEAKPHLY